MSERDAPRSGAFFTSLTFAAIPFASAATITNVTELASQARASVAVHVVACAVALCVTAVAARWWRSSRGVDFLRRLALASVLSALPAIVGRACPDTVAYLAWSVCAFIGALAGPEVAALTRAVRASRAAGEDYLFEHSGLSVAALVACLATLLAGAALPPYLGAGRSLVVSSLLLLPWAAFGALRGALQGGLRGGASPSMARTALACGVSLGVACGIAFARADRLILPRPLLLTPRKWVEATTRLAPDAWLWSRSFGEGTVLRVHGDNDLVHYEAADDVRFAESAVHPAAALRPARRALVLGNESGSVARELLKYESIQRIVHVSFVPGLTRAFLEHPHLRPAHDGALIDARVVRREVARLDELPRVVAGEPRFDLIVVAAAGPLAAVKWLLQPRGRAFLKANVAPSGFTVRRLPSLSEPSFAWCFVEEMRAEGWHTLAYKLTLAGTTFDQLLLELSSRTDFDPAAMKAMHVPTRYLTDLHLRHLQRFGRDEAYEQVPQPEHCADELGVTE